MAAVLDVTYYTDPLCSWSWAFEPIWRRLRYELGSNLTWRYRMGGLLERADRFADPINAISRPAQLGPRWYEVSQQTGMPIDSHLWLEDPPWSSFPACLAVKAADLQGAEVGERFLRRLRAAALLERRNVARGEVLLACAAEVAVQDRDDLTFDPAQFAEDLAGAEARSAFEDDLRETRFREIGRFPSLVLRGTGSGRAAIIVGYRPYAMLRDAIAHVAPETTPIQEASDPVQYAQHWPEITAPEVAEAVSLDLSAVTSCLDQAVAHGFLEKTPSGELRRSRSPVL